MPRRIESNRLPSNPQVKRTVVAEYENLIYDNSVHDTTPHYLHEPGFEIVRAQIVKVEGEPRKRVIPGPVTSIVLDS